MRRTPPGPRTASRVQPASSDERRRSPGSRRAKREPAESRAAPKAATTDDWQLAAAENLDRFAAELPAQCSTSPLALHDELRGLFLRVAVASVEDALLGAAGSDRAGAMPAPSAKPAWRELLERLSAGPRHWLGATSSLPSLASHEFTDDSVAELLAWARALGRRAQSGIDGPVRELGAVYELLLGLRLERLERPARRLRRARGWLEPSAVLEWAPPVRSRRLQELFCLSKHSVDTLRESLAAATCTSDVERALEGLLDPHHAARSAGRYVVQPSLHRRSRGAHYTPWALCQELVRRTLDPILAKLPEPKSSSLLELTVCDPAMGAGVFLIAVADHLARELVAARLRENANLAKLGDPLDARARRDVAERTLFGVDKDPVAVGLARLTLSWFGFGPGATARDIEQRLRQGDALIGAASDDVSESDAQSQSTLGDALHWSRAFPSVFARQAPGFDAIVGNPPWVAYVGRAAQPLPPALAAHYAATNPAFRRYRTLHGLFVYRSATLLRETGRLGLILPTSVADLDGYAATRAAHDALCKVDAELPDFGDGAFTGVFQPSMALLSTRRTTASTEPQTSIWPLQNHDLSAGEHALLERLRRLPKFPPEQFGERGFQTTRDDRVHLARLREATGPYRVALREGADITEFRAWSPRVFADEKTLGTRLRPPADWQKVAVLIRQTARFPIAARADGAAFRNSILAGFASAEYTTQVLLCFLNSSLARWAHYALHRDARQGMPQLKVGHLRALPAPPLSATGAMRGLARLGTELGSQNDGIDAARRRELDELVAGAFSLSADEREMIERWAFSHPLPISRRSTAAGTLPTGGPSSVLEVAASG